MKKPSMFLTLVLIVLTACNAQTGQTTGESKSNKDIFKIKDYVADKGYEGYAEATFAGGCFWCTEASFEQINGVIDVISGYSGGKIEYPTYYQVASGRTRHAEAIQIYYDPAIISYETLLNIFFTAHDPTTKDRQGPDVGPQYRSEIFYRTAEEKALIDKVIAEKNGDGSFSNPIVTNVSKYQEFWTAEAYHQDYYPNNPSNAYIVRVSRPKVEKVKKVYKELLKAEYK
ncbi:MAG: peptide-methionine (S)-S-oxide reductase MsrA [Bacteroidota bacterium]